MARDIEALITKRMHDLYLVLRHRAERVVGVVRRLRWCRTVAIAAQIRGHDMKTFGETRRHRVPGDMRQGIAVQQQQRWSVAAMPQTDARATGLDVGEREARHDVHKQILWFATR